MRTVTIEHIENQVVTEQYHVFDGTVLTVCALTLQNGFVVTGESAPVDPNNFDGEVGKQIAREQAIDKIWSLEGYLLKDKLSSEEE